jgi:hypothetical protein
MDPDTSSWRKTGHFYFALTISGQKFQGRKKQRVTIRFSS